MLVKKRVKYYDYEQYPVKIERLCGIR